MGQEKDCTHTQPAPLHLKKILVVFSLFLTDDKGVDEVNEVSHLAEQKLVQYCLVEYLITAI